MLRRTQGLPLTIHEIVDNNQTETVSADYSQGDVRFGFNAGKQCVAMSLTSIVHNSILSVNVLDTALSNTMLQTGNNLFGYNSNSVNKDFSLLIYLNMFGLTTKHIVYNTLSHSRVLCQ